MRRLNDRKKNYWDSKIGYSRHVIDTDPLDVEFFKEVKEKNPKIAATLEEASVGYEQFAELQEDIFASLYRYKPHRLKDFQIAAKYLLNHHVMGNVMESPKYKELRALTRQDVINSTVGTEVLGDEAKKIIEELKEQMEKLQEAMDAEKAAQDAEKGEGKGEEGEGEGEGEGDGEGKSSEKLTLKEAQKKLEDARKELQKSMKKKEVQSKINKALDTTKESIKETSDMIENWGLGGDDSFTRMPYHEKMEMLKQLRENSKLKKIAELAGRFKRIAIQRQHEKVKKGMDEIYDLSLGKDIGRIIISEMMRLKHPVARKLFYKDYVEGKLLQYELNGKEKKVKGAIVVCIDNSGSMSGDPEVWSKSVAMAMLEIAQYQKRSFYCIHFDHTRDPNKLHTNVFKKDDGKNIQEVIDMASYFSGGGTEFEPALEKSKMVIEDDTDFTKADIIFISDGEAPVRDDWVKKYNEWRKEHKVKIYGVLIDSYSNSSASMDLFCDDIKKLSTINEAENEELAISLFDDV